MFARFRETKWIVFKCKKSHRCNGNAPAVPVPCACVTIMLVVDHKMLSQCHWNMHSTHIQLHMTQTHDAAREINAKTQHKKNFRFSNCQKLFLHIRHALAGKLARSEGELTLKSLENVCCKWLRSCRRNAQSRPHPSRQTRHQIRRIRHRINASSLLRLARAALHRQLQAQRGL